MRRDHVTDSGLDCKVLLKGIEKVCVKICSEFIRLTLWSQVMFLGTRSSFMKAGNFMTRRITANCLRYPLPSIEHENIFAVSYLSRVH
jgi:hypothetical protein